MHSSFTGRIEAAFADGNTVQQQGQGRCLMEHNSSCCTSYRACDHTATDGRASMSWGHVQLVPLWEARGSKLSRSRGLLINRMV